MFRSVEGPFPVTVSFFAEPAGGGTRLTWVGEPQVPGIVPRLLGPLMARKGNGQLRDGLARLKRQLEG